MAPSMRANCLKSGLLDVVKAALGDEAADNIRLPQRNETIPLALARPPRSCASFTKLSPML